jgi:hypothetical protein
VWARFRRRSLAPRRPAVFPEQWGLVLVTALAVVAGVAVVLAVLIR